MTDLSIFPITKKWPAEYPDRIQLYSLPTPNGVKASIMLEETGLPYEPHLVRFDANDQLSPEYLSLNPYGKIPSILDPSGPNGKPLPLFESGAILIYLADKSGKLLPVDPAQRYETLQGLCLRSVASVRFSVRLDSSTNLQVKTSKINGHATATSRKQGGCLAS